MTDISKLPVIDLLRLNAETVNELRRREIIRTSNKPLGDYAEFLYCKAFGWSLKNNSAKDIDAIDANGIRYQIKCRTLKPGKTRVPLGAIRRLCENNFDFAAVILFNTDCSINRSALIPYQIILNGAKFRASTNSWRFMLRPETWNLEDVVDTTEKLKAQQNLL